MQAFGIQTGFGTGIAPEDQLMYHEHRCRKNSRLGPPRAAESRLPVNTSPSLSTLLALGQRVHSQDQLQVHVLVRVPAPQNWAPPVSFSRYRCHRFKNTDKNTGGSRDTHGTHGHTGT